MWRLVEGDVEVLSLLIRAGDCAACDVFLEGIAAAADFAVDDVVSDGFARVDGAVKEVLADVVDDAGDFTDLAQWSV
jgi:hypothetical protein